MLVSDIIAAARQYTQIVGSSWFAETDELRSVNRAYRDIYEKIVDSNDEYFIKAINLVLTDFTEVEPNIYEYTLPADWYRLRSLFSRVASGVKQVDRYDPNDISRVEGYRYFNNTLRLISRNPAESFIIEYYPTPAEYTATTDEISYPPQLEPLIIAYQIAMDIIKAANGDPSAYAEEYLRLWNRFEHATMRRDNSHYPRVANVYRSTYPGW